MNTRQRSAIVLITGLVLATGTACAPGAGEAEPGSSATSTATQTSSPEPTSSPSADPEDPTTWIISEEGVGPIEIGGRLAETLAELPPTWTNDENCSWTAWWNADDSSYGVFFVRGTESEDAPVREISVYTAAETPVAVPSPVTDKGLGVGATTEEVLAAYPDAEEGVASAGAGTWLKVPGDAEAHIFFEYREGAAGASDVVVTIGEQPSYEVCG
ncbi:hypothetical protein QFZ53_002136 [Microbacterium natoriense]|uniref:Lipoprotein n=1 Tax=Microbacterium natoriense TaxID=284570 RepID=A0AAW8EWT3_9MICO|nr:hypothetical protein [Microbacterium natoriense]MDQ0647940.1 hypothetical protein [Microbacterium natoriense]